jgi:hypothetical protein
VRSASQHVYRVIFLNQGNVYEIYARQVSQSAMLGFVEVGQIVFGDPSKVVIDPSEERLKTEFAGVKRVYVPIHSVVRIDEVERGGAGRITTAEAGAKVSPFPIFTPRGAGATKD